MQKIERGDKVAVLYSPGFGAGWSTWNREHTETLCFDHEIVNAVLAGDAKKAAEIAEQKCPGVYTGGAYKLKVEWIPKGTIFEITEYDGSESIEQHADKQYIQA